MFSEKLLHWYDENGRDLPWRKTNDPYKIWLSEIILQQTRIEQGKDYWFRFIENYPTIKELAAASEEEVLKLWQGLGYYSRARNLHAAAIYIEKELDGRFPDSYDEILKLKGVGKYTAAAIASFAFKEPRPVIDGNVYRFISRVFCIETPIGTDKAHGEFERVLNNLIDKENPDLFNQALMDFGSTYCKPSGCDCDNCIFAQECMAKLEGKVEFLPIKGQVVEKKRRYLYYLDIQWNEDGRQMTIFQQRDNKDIWKGLYEFPLFESTQELGEKEMWAKVKELISTVTKDGAETLEVSCTMNHQLTHRDIRATFIKAILKNGKLPKGTKWQVMTIDDIRRKPISRLIDRYLKKGDATSF